MDRLVAALICSFARFFTGARALWSVEMPSDKVRIYFPNHRSHGDFLLVWAALPPRLRRTTRPVAGKDYWLSDRLKRYIITRVFNGVLVERNAGANRNSNPLETLGQALQDGQSLIMFPEGTRNQDDELLPFKSGIYHLAMAHPEVELVPVWINNLGRVMPKGQRVPVPLLCSLTFGAPMRPQADESKDDFLQRARQSLLDLAPPAD